MINITFIEVSSNKKYDVQAVIGQTLMEVAVANNIPRIKGECGGACSCGTCHVYLEKDWALKLSPTSIMEDDVLTFLDNVKPVSRLACQISLTPEMEGMQVYLP